MTVTVDCGWPFHNLPGCVKCEEYEALYAEGVDEWLRQKQEIGEAARAQRRSK